MKRLLVNAFIALTSTGLLTACSSIQQERDVFPDDPAYAPVSAQSLEAPPTNELMSTPASLGSWPCIGLAWADGDGVPLSLMGEVPSNRSTPL